MKREEEVYDPEEIHAAWAPMDGAWSDWVKPVLFGCLPDDVEGAPPTPWLASGRLGALVGAADVAVVVDLPSDDAVWTGLRLAGLGFQPIPLFNAFAHPEGIVDLTPIVHALVAGAELLAARPPQGLPAFLLDAGRMSEPRSGKRPRFDNRSIVRATDFPTPALLAERGVKRVLLIQGELGRPAPDLERILLSWQDSGLDCWQLARSNKSAAQPFPLRRRPFLARWWESLTHPVLSLRKDDVYGGFGPQGG